MTAPSRSDAVLLLPVVLVIGVVAFAWIAVSAPSGSPAVVDPAQPGPVARPTVDAAVVAPPSEEPATALDLTAEAQPATDEPPGTTVLSLHGRVLDLDGAPIPGARLRWLPRGHVLVHTGQVGLEDDTPRYMSVGPVRHGDLDWSALSTTHTDDEGRFVLPARTILPRETYGEPAGVGLEFGALLVDAKGFTSLVLEQRELAADPSAFELVLEPEAVLTGRLVDAEGRPLRGEIHGWQRQGELQPLGLSAESVGSQGGQRVPGLHVVPTDADGQFRLPGLWGGTVRLSIRAPGRVRHAREEPLAAGEQRALGDLVLEAGRSLSGRVVDPGGTPIAGARVDVSRSTIRGAYAYDMGLAYGEDHLLDAIRQVRQKDHFDHGITDAQGRFRISGLDQPLVTVYATAPAHEPTMLEGAGAASTDLELVLPPQGLLIVEVRDDGEPAQLLADASVSVTRLTSAERPQLSWPREILTGDAARAVEPSFEAAPGRFLAVGVGPVAQLVQATAPGHAPRSEQLGGVAPGALDTLSLSLGRAGRIEGKVLDGTGAGLAGAQVRLTPADDVKRMVVAVSLTDEGGRFAFEGLAGATYGLYARAPGHAESELLATQVTEGELLALEPLVLTAAATVEGVLLDAEGRPRDAGRIQHEQPPYDTFQFAELSEEFERSADVDADGRFRFEGLAAGLHLFSVRGLPSVEVELQPGEQRRIELRPSPTISVRGQVTAGGRPVAGVGVHSRLLHSPTGAQAPWSKVPTTDTEGRYELALPLPGTWSAWTRGAGTPDGDDVGGDAVQLELVAGEERTLDFALPGGEIVAQVRDAASGAPVAAHVSLCIEGNRQLCWNAADEDGQLVFRGLAPGRYRLHTAGWAEGERGRTFVARWYPEFELSADGRRDDLLLELSTGGSLEGSVTNAEGLTVQDGATVWLVAESLDEPEAGFVPGTSTSFQGGVTRVELPDSDGPWETTRVRDGRFRFERLPTGLYRVACGAESVDQVRSQGTATQVRLDETTELTLTVLTP